MRTKQKSKPTSKHHAIATKKRHIRVPVTQTMGDKIDAAAAKQLITTAQFMREAAMDRIEEGK